jgi:hypothetical protein
MRAAGATPAKRLLQTELPLTGTGKIDRQALSREAAASLSC